MFYTRGKTIRTKLSGSRVKALYHDIHFRLLFVSIWNQIFETKFSKWWYDISPWLQACRSIFVKRLEIAYNLKYFLTVGSATWRSRRRWLSLSENGKGFCGSKWASKKRAIPIFRSACDSTWWCRNCRKAPRWSGKWVFFLWGICGVYWENGY